MVSNTSSPHNRVHPMKKIFHELYIRFMVWFIGAAPPPGYEYLLNSRLSKHFLFKSNDVQENKVEHPNPIPKVFIIFVILTVLFIWSGRIGIAPSWTGFGEIIRLKDDAVEYLPAKTFWDWLELLIIPGVLFGVGFWVNSTVRKSEREIETDRLQENVLQNYFDKMTELLIDEELDKSELQKNVRDIARVRTLTVLEQLDGIRRGILVKFLYEAGLINSRATVRLQEANLRDIILASVLLMNSNLNGCDMSYGDLSDANLRGSDMRAVKLRKALLDIISIK